MVRGIVDVRTVLINAVDGTGKEETLLAFIAGDQVVVVPNTGKPAQSWLRDAVLAKLREKDHGKSGGPESV